MIYILYIASSLRPGMREKERERKKERERLRLDAFSSSKEVKHAKALRT